MRCKQFGANRDQGQYGTTPGRTVTGMSTLNTVIVSCVCLSTIFTVVTSVPYIVNYEEPGIFRGNDVLNTREPTDLPLLGNRKCTRGPAYWCYNITQAKECGAVKHCIAKVWEPLKLPQDNDTVCDVCKEMVQEARDTLLSNETQDELRQVLEGSCKLIPLKEIANECCKLADDFIPELIDALASRMDPQTVCAVSGLCNSVRIDEMLGQLKEIEQKPEKFELTTDSCPKCSHFVGKYLEKFKEFNKDQLLHKIFEICGYLGSYSDACRASAIDDIDSIYSYVQSQANAVEACGLVGLCQVVSLNPVRVDGFPNGVQAWTPPPQKVGDYQCEFCKLLVKQLKQWFTTDTTKEEFKDIALGLCKSARKYSAECTKMVDENGEMIYDLVAKELDPNSACTFLEQCNNNATIRGRVTLFSSASDPTPLWTILHSDTFMTKLSPADVRTGDDERPSHQPGFAYPMIPLESAEDIEDFERDTLLETMPMTRLTPAEQRTGTLKSTIGDILPTCGLCTFTVGKIFDLLVGKNLTKESIDHAVESVCYVIPNQYQDGCLTFMKEYGDRVAEMIVVEGSAHAICIALHLCLLSPMPTQNLNVPLITQAYLPFDRYMPHLMVQEELGKEEVDGKPICPLCEFVVARLDSMLADNATEHEIKDTVEQICNYMPHTVRSECRDFIDEYGDMIIKYLTEQMDPETICTELKLCHRRIVDLEDYPMDLTGINKCQLCQLIASYLSAFLDDPTVDTSIESMVEKVCPLLPPNHRDQCKQLIEDYGPYILSELAQATDKGKVCSSINLCPEAQ